MDMINGLDEYEFMEYLRNNLDEYIEFGSIDTNIDYRKLLKFIFSVSESFMFVVRNDIELNNSYKDLLERLESNRIESIKSNYWANTFTKGDPLDLHFFKSNEQTQAILISVSKKLSDWKPPNLPEDICFFKGKKYIFMTCIHEDMGFLTKEYAENLVPHLV